MKIKLLIFILLFLISPALGDINPITSHEVIRDFSNNTTAGITNYYEIIFTTNHATTVSMTFTVMNNSSTAEVWMNDWEVNYTLNGDIITPTEVSNSTFTANSKLSVGIHNLIVTYTPVTNLIPGNYTLSLDLSAEGYTIEKKSSGGGRSNWYYYQSLTPTVTPTPVIESDPPVVEPIPPEITSTESITIVLIPEDEPMSRGMKLFIASGILASIAIIAIIYRYLRFIKRERNRQKQM